MLLLFFSLMGLRFKIKNVSLGKSKPHKSEISLLHLWEYLIIVKSLLSFLVEADKGRSDFVFREVLQMSRLVTSERWMVGESGQGIWLICRNREPSSLRLCQMNSKAKVFGELELVYS